MGRLIEKLKRTKSLILSALGLMAALAIAVSAVFGWFSANKVLPSGGFIVNVTGGVSATLMVDGEPYTEGSFAPQNMAPGDKYLFEISIISERDALARITLINPKGAFSEDGVTGDMADIIAVRYPEDSESYLRISELSGSVVADGITVNKDVEKTVKFYLLFAAEALPGIDIDIYQGKTFSIDGIVVELY